ncbi:tetraspanin [Cadophora sp. DSE1049]|nr:tetraspanin [Cadophora sp. DSE1049]
MARDSILLTYMAMDAAFVISGGLLIIFALVTKAEIASGPSADKVARDLLFDMCPLNAAIGNAVMVFVTFLLTVPAIVMPMTRGWLKLSGYMMVVCAFFTMVIGLDIWFETLKTRENLFVIWKKQPSTTQSLLQQEFLCCGYLNSTSPPFVVDTTCPNALVAAAQGGCVAPLASYANNFLDVIFTGAFGIVGVDVALIIMTAILLKDRKEKERYRHIDEKSGAGAF